LDAGDIAQKIRNRKEVVSELQNNLRLETPNPIYNTMFALAKVRGAESIFDSKLGLVHSPGGGRYYIGFWANDQAEYINPFFPYLGYDLGNEAALNMWRVYQQAIPEDDSNIRYSFEMEGDSPANPLDRGDAAMIAYGLSHYLLALGDKDIAEELWPLLSWCLDYNNRKLNEYGVVMSESDEMEGRIETGDANLSTSSLYYGVVEAYPEGNMAHLSAESGLYCRVFTEGLFGILPTGFRSFRLQPRMPKGWDKMALRNIHAFGQQGGFDIEVSRIGQNMTVIIKDHTGKELSRGTMYTEDTMTVKLPE